MFDAQRRRNSQRKVGLRGARLPRAPLRPAQPMLAAAAHRAGAYVSKRESFWIELGRISDNLVDDRTRSR